jgi:hypothetical protein
MLRAGPALQLESKCSTCAVPLGESEHERFKRFAKAILAVPKSEICQPQKP